MERKNLLCVENLSKSFGAEGVRGISFEVEEGEYFVLLGPSGAGKTVILELIAGLLVPDSGRVLLSGKDVTREKIQKRRVGLVYQTPTLFPHLTVRQNIAYGLASRRMGRTQRRQRVQQLAEELGIGSLLDRFPGTLSGGEYKRVSLARTIATEPLCLLLDEPLASLDVQGRSELRAVLRRLNRSGQTMVHVTHDFEEALSLASKVAVIEEGRLVQGGAPEEVFGRPRSDFVARLLGVKNFFKGVLRPSRGSDVAEFVTNGICFHVLASGQPRSGYLSVRSSDVVISRRPFRSSAQNTFRGQVADIAPGTIGVEVTVDIGLPVVAVISRDSLKNLNLQVHQTVWVHFKASAVRFLPDHDD